MILIENNQLVFSVPEVHPSAALRVAFQREMFPHDDAEGDIFQDDAERLPLYHVDDFAGKIPDAWVEHGGIILPMAQSEAMKLTFESEDTVESGAGYPFAVLVAAGKINAVTGRQWENLLAQNPQNYLVTPDQRRLDGYYDGSGMVRQFLAVPMGSGQTVEEQMTGQAEWGGLQIMAFPMKSDVFMRRFPRRESSRANVLCESSPSYGLGMARGRRKKQKHVPDPYDLADWDTTNAGRCFVHIVDAGEWRQITGWVKS